jgi:hypothetical protein
MTFPHPCVISLSLDWFKLYGDTEEDERISGPVCFVQAFAGGTEEGHNNFR